MVSRIDRRHFGRGVSAAALATGIFAPAVVRAQAFPTQDMHFICGFPPGSGADLIVRFFAEKIRPLAGRPIIVENKPGALGNIATEYVVRSKPDGHTLYITGATVLATNQHLLKNPTVNVTEALQMVGTINRQPIMIAVSSNSPHQTIAQLTKAMKEKGDKASYATSNPAAKVVGALYKERAGLQSVDVQYRSGAEFLNDLTSGNIDYAIPDNVFALAQAQARAGRMRILAVSTGQRLQAAPDYPTMAELGYPMDLVAWWGGFVPSATPRPIVHQLGKWLSQIVASDEGKAFLNNIASDPWVNTPDQAQAYFREQIEAWREYVKIAKIEPQG